MPSFCDYVIFPLPYNLGSPGMCHLTLTLTFSLLALINLHQFFMLGSLSPLPYNVGSSYILYLIHIFIMVFTCQSGICHLTLTSFSWSTDFIKFTSSFHYGVTFSTPYNLGSPCLVQTFIMEGTCQTYMCHLSLTSFSVYRCCWTWLGQFLHYMYHTT